MAEEKHLTVAELLARNSQGEVPRRRRRRSLDEGGVSVAELTGSMKKVEATPAQPKHSSVDIDETAPVIPRPEAAKPAVEEPAAAKPADAKPAAKPADAKPAADKPAPVKAEAAKPAAAQQSAAEAERAAELARAEEIKKAEFARKAEEAKRAAAARKQEAADAKAAEDKRILAERDAKRKAARTPSEDDTSVISKVLDSTAAGAATADASAEKAFDTAEIERVQDDVAEAATPATADDARSAELEKKNDADLDFDEDWDEEFDEEPGLNPVSIVLLALVGVVLGAVVFKGFEILWGSFNRGIVAALAVAMTGIMAGVVHALRTHRDRFTVTLAVVVGLVLTFGPLLIVR